jgi:hypothetical protein
MPYLRGRHVPWLGLILLGGAALRLWGIDFGLPHPQCRPDESTLVHKALAIGAGDLNPHFFNYPSLHFYLLAILYGVYWAGGWLLGLFPDLDGFVRLFFVDPTSFYLIGRWLGAAMGTASILLVYHLGVGLGGVRVGLLAAFFFAVSFLHSRDSHFLTVDVPALFYALGALVCAGRFAARGRRWDWLGAVCLFGLAASTKYNVVLLAAALIPVLVKAKDPWRLVGLGALIMPAVFLITTPFSLLDFDAFWHDLSFERRHFSEGHGLDLGVGWWYHLRFSLFHGVGWPLLLMGLAGGVWALYRPSVYGYMVLAAALAYFGVAGGGKTVFMRYMIPMVPLLCLLAAGIVGQGSRRWRGGWVALLALVLAWPSMARTWQHGLLLARQDTRLLAAEWIEANVPTGSVVAISGSEYGYPRLNPSRSWLGQRLDDVQQAGLAGARLKRMLRLDGYPPEPNYYLISLRPPGDIRLQSVVSPAGIGRLVDQGVGWVVIQEHPLDAVQTAFEVELRSIAAPVVSFIGLAETRRAVFDPIDMYYLPVDGFSGVLRPGPNLRIYRLAKDRT